VYSPVASVVKYADSLFDDEAEEKKHLGNEKQQRRLNLKGKKSEVPIYAMVARDEDPRFARQIRRWGRRDKRVKLRSVKGGHLGNPDDRSIYNRNVAQALGWLDKRVQEAREQEGSVSEQHLREAAPKGRDGKAVRDPDYERKHPRAPKGRTGGGQFIRKGSAGPAVQSVQRAVKAKPDGKFGERTERAVRRFQRQNDLVVDGVVGRQTAAALLGQGKRKIGALATEQQRKLRKLREASVRGAISGAVGRAGSLIDWDPRLHPRNRIGQFRDVLSSLEVGGQARFPDGVKVEKRSTGTFAVRGGGREMPTGPSRMGAALPSQISGAERAARDALQRSAMNRSPESLGGDRPVSLEELEGQSRPDPRAGQPLMRILTGKDAEEYGFNQVRVTKNSGEDGKAFAGEGYVARGYGGPNAGPDGTATGEGDSPEAAIKAMRAGTGQSRPDSRSGRAKATPAEEDAAQRRLADAGVPTHVRNAMLVRQQTNNPTIRARADRIIDEHLGMGQSRPDPGGASDAQHEALQLLGRRRYTLEPNGDIVYQETGARGRGYRITPDGSVYNGTGFIPEPRDRADPEDTLRLDRIRSEGGARKGNYLIRPTTDGRFAVVRDDGVGSAQVVGSPEEALERADNDTFSPRTSVSIDELRRPGPVTVPPEPDEPERSPLTATQRAKLERDRIDSERIRSLGPSRANRFRTNDDGSRDLIDADGNVIERAAGPGGVSLEDEARLESYSLSQLEDIADGDGPLAEAARAILRRRGQARPDIPNPFTRPDARDELGMGSAPPGTGLGEPLTERERLVLARRWGASVNVGNLRP
jgi:hypothetical protein